VSRSLEVIGAIPASVWVALSLASLGASIVGVLAIPWLVCRMPVDWFARPPQSLAMRLRASPGATVARNGAGLLLTLLGVALLFLPGQGILTIVLGLVLTDLPVRDRGIRWVATRPALARQLQAWRARANVAPFAGLSVPSDA
jgi:hypothetical protein